MLAARACRVCRRACVRFLQCDRPARAYARPALHDRRRRASAEPRASRRVDRAPPTSPCVRRSFRRRTRVPCRVRRRPWRWVRVLGQGRGADPGTSHTAWNGWFPTVGHHACVGGRWVRILCQGRGADPGTSHTAGNGWYPAVGRHLCVGGSRVRVLCQGRGADPSDAHHHGGGWLLGCTDVCWRVGGRWDPCQGGGADHRDLPRGMGMGGARLAGHHVCVGGRWVRVQRGRPKRPHTRRGAHTTPRQQALRLTAWRGAGAHTHHVLIATTTTPGSRLTACRGACARAMGTPMGLFHHRASPAWDAGGDPVSWLARVHTTPHYTSRLYG